MLTGSYKYYIATERSYRSAVWLIGGIIQRYFPTAAECIIYARPYAQVLSSPSLLAAAKGAIRRVSPSGCRCFVRAGTWAKGIVSLLCASLRARPGRGPALGDGVTVVLGKVLYAGEMLSALLKRQAAHKEEYM